MCGSARTGAIIESSFESTAKALDSWRVQRRDPSRRSADKLRADDFSGWDWSVDRQKYVRKESLIDRDANRRYEKVIDPDTGEVIHHCDYPLTEHCGHGSAKESRAVTKATQRPDDAGPAEDAS